MSFLEFFGERFNRGPSGDLRFERENLPVRPSPYALAWLFASLLAIALWTMMLWRVSTTWTGFLVAMALSTAYVLIAARARPRPDYSNVGFVGGLIDHPFRISDDYNRLLAFLILFFLPGRLIANGLRHGLVALRQ